MGAATREPAVSVIVPVYNTLPHLLECLDSLVAQTLRPDLEVLAVDDGSTDGSGATLDEYAARHPELFTVVHQVNSGGPASPCNRGLERARGRYVSFLGADDHLAPDAMERLVRAADAWDSDIAFGRAEGVNGRGVWQPIFAETVPDMDLYDSLLPFTVSNSKLFRRSLVEEHGLRFPEDLKVGSDQPFTIQAMVHARRISVLADETYLYVSRRDDSGNITFSADAADRLHFVTRIMALVAELLEPGPRRDALLRRHFRWELSRLFGELFEEMDDATRRRLCAEFGPLCDAYLTPRIVEALPVASRVRLELARRGEVQRVLDVYRAEQAGPGFATDGRGLFRDLPGLEEAVLPRDLYAVQRQDQPVVLADGVEARRLRWRRPPTDAPAGAEPVLVVHAVVPLRLLGEVPVTAQLALVADDGSAVGWPAEVAVEGDGLHLRGEVGAAALRDAAGPAARSLRFRIALPDRPVDVGLPLEEPRRPVVLGGAKILLRPGRSGRATVRRKAID
ncbi:MAG: glycosyltransferase [Marmoricola sp.]